MKKTILAMAVLATCVGGAKGYELLSYEFKDTPTPSQVDPDYVLDVALTATDITEFGDPDGGGSSPELTNFTGYSLNIKRNSVDANPTNFSDYLTFEVSALNTNEGIDPEQLNLTFNSFSDHFSIVVFVDAGGGFNQVASLGGTSNSNLAFSSQSLDISSVPTAHTLVFRIECVHALPGGAANTTLQFSEIGLEGQVVSLSRPTSTLLSYGFKTSPTPSQVDPDYVANTVWASDITEFGDPDEGGSSPELTNFSGASLNIKRRALDTSLTNFSDYLTFELGTSASNKVIDVDNIEMRFNNFSDNFSLAVYVDEGNGFNQMATLGGTDNSALANSTQQLYVDAVGTSLVFRIECAHSSPDAGGNTTLQFGQIDLNGAVVDQVDDTPVVDAIGDVAWQLLDGTTNQIVLTWASTNGAAYAVESTSDLVFGTWSNVYPGVIGNGGDISVTDTVAQAQSFYRVIAE